MNAVPDATGKQAAGDAGKDSLQSSFSAVIGATVAAAANNGDARLVKAQNVDTKKTSGPESGKKNASSNSVDVSNAAPAVHESILVNTVVPVVPQIAIQPVVVQQQSGSSAKDSVEPSSAVTDLNSPVAKVVSVFGTAGSVDLTKAMAPVTLPAVAGSSRATDTASSTPSSSAMQIDPTPTSRATAATPVINNASVENVPTNAVATTELKTATPAVSTAGLDNTIAGKIAVSSPAKNNVINATPASTLTPVANNEKPGVPVSSDVAAVREIMMLPQAVPAQAQETAAVPAQASVTSSTAVQAQVTSSTSVQLHAASSIPSQAQVVTSITPSALLKQSANSVATAPKGSSSDSVKPASLSVTSAIPATVAVATPALKPNSEPVSAAPIQSGNTVDATSAAASAQTIAPTPSDPSPVSTPQPAEASVTAATQQTETIAVAVPQQVVLQSAEVATVPSNAAAFNAPAGKSGAVSASNQISGNSKSKATSSDWRINRSVVANDDSSSSTSAASGTAATRVIGSGAEAGVVSKEVGGNIKGALESAVLAQNAQSAQTAGQAVPSAPPAAPLAATQDSSVAAGSTLAAPGTSTESTQAAHALNSAQLIQSVHGSEMRLGMNSAEFGNISINTSINHQTLSAQISMDHSALGSALAMHLPAIEEKLGSAYGLQAKVELRDTASNSTASDSNSSQSSGDRRSQGGSTGRSAAGLPSSIGALTSSNFTTSSTSTSMAAASSRLDIRI